MRRAPVTTGGARGHGRRVPWVVSVVLFMAGVMYFHLTEMTGARVLQEAGDDGSHAQIHDPQRVGLAQMPLPPSYRATWVRWFPGSWTVWLPVFFVAVAACARLGSERGTARGGGLRYVPVGARWRVELVG